MEPPAQVKLQVLRGLAEAEGKTDIDWSMLQGSPEGTFDALLDLAESGTYWVVLDDLYQEDIEEADELLIQLASFAQRSRWIVTSRRKPDLPQLAAQLRTLAGLEEGSMTKLAHAWAPDAGDFDVRKSVAEAAGSPWMLYQRLASPSAALAAEGSNPLAGLAPEAMRFLRLLSVFDGSVPPSLLPSLTHIPDDDILGPLKRRGLLDEGPAGMRLHDVARKLIRTDGSDERFHAEAQRVADVLTTLDDPETLLEAARLLTDLGREKDLEALLAAQGDRFLALGYAPRLWQVLRKRELSRFDEWRLRCAAELGNPTALAQVQAPVGAEPMERLAWARTLLAEGDIEGALSELDEGGILGTSDGLGNHVDAGVQVEAIVLKAEALRFAGRSSEALDVLDPLAGVEGPLRNRVEAVAALCALSGGDVPRADLSALVRSALESPNDTELSAHVAEVLVILGRLEGASQVVEAARATPRGAPARLLSSRRLILLAARIALSRGHLEDARALVDHVRPYARSASLLLPLVRVLETRLKIMSGELAELAPQLQAWQAEIRGIDVEAEAELQTLRLRLGLVMAEEPIRDALDLDESTPYTRRHLAWERMHRARASGDVRGAPTRSRQAREDPRISILDDLAEATKLLVEGDSATASVRALGAEREAERLGMGAIRAEALCLVADSLLCAKRTDELGSTARLLEHLSSRMPSSRFHEESLFYTSLASRTVPAALLERLASMLLVAPVAARRAQALLGYQTSLDLLDLRVLEVLASTGAIQTIEPALPFAEDETPSWQPGWGIDEDNGQVWFEDGSTVDLDPQTISFKFLKTLFDHGGEATKEQLIIETWKEREYHPLRHDGRVHVAVNKLRELLDVGQPSVERLLTTSSGYRLGGTPRRARNTS